MPWFGSSKVKETLELAVLFAAASKMTMLESCHGRLMSNATCEVWVGAAIDEVVCALFEFCCNVGAERVRVLNKKMIKVVKRWGAIVGDEV
jgi:hypothetical protein